MDEKVKKEIEKRVGSGSLTCAEARKIAEDLGVSYKVIRETADKLKIKITDCALGCF